MTPEIEVTLKSLKSNHFNTRLVQTAAGAKKTILDMIPLTATVGIGDSATVRQIGILEGLARKGTEIVNPFTKELTRGVADHPAIFRRFVQMLRKTFSTDVFLTSSNAVTEDGKIVSIDRVGNRVAGMIFGAEKVILPIGRNKLVKNVDEAIYRIKNAIAPAHAYRKEHKTPCTVTGKCNDCDSPDRICSITVILEKRPLHTDFSIILINENLGLGWDPPWDEKHISEIRSNHYQNTWVFSPPKSE